MLRRSGAAGRDCAELGRGPVAISLWRDFCGSGWSSVGPAAGGEGRSGNDYLYVWDFGGSQGRGADGGECGLHAGPDGRASGAIDGGLVVWSGGAGPHLPLFAVYFCGVVDCAAYVSEAAEPGHDQYRFVEDRE